MIDDKIVYCPTLLHKLIMKNPEAVKPLITRMKKEWPKLWIPHVSNNNGLTPLKLAYDQNHRRVLGWLLDHLKDYPFGYGQFEIANMISGLINEKFETKIGSF